MHFSFLRDFLSSWTEIPEQEWQAFEKLLTVKKVVAGEVLVQEGDSSNFAYFVNQGLIELFYSTSDGKELICRFCKENEFAGSYIGFLTNFQAECTIRVIEDSDLVQFDYRLWRSEFLKRHICWEIAARKTAEMEFLVRAYRERLFLTDEAKARLLKFKKAFPELAERLPQNKIASYLGISPVSLSRINRNL